MKNNFCSNCGKKLQENANFCGECGTAISTETSSTSKTKTQKVTKQPIESLPDSQRKILLIAGVCALLIAGVYFKINFMDTVEGKAFFQQQAAGAEDHSGHDHEKNPHTEVPQPMPISQEEFDAINKQLEKAPKSPILNIQMGNMLFDTGKFAEAIPHYKTALAENPNLPDVKVDLGVCYFNMSDFKTAHQEFSEALKIDPNHINALYNMGVVAIQIGNINELISHWQKLREVAPESPQSKKASQYLENIHQQMEQEAAAEKKNSSSE